MHAWSFISLPQVTLPSELNPLSRLTNDEWVSVLRLSSKWGFSSVSNLAVRAVEQAATDVTKIELSRKYGVGERLLDAFEAVCRRPQPLSVEEGERLDVKDIICITAAREAICSRGSLLRGNQLRELLSSFLEYGDVPSFTNGHSNNEVPTDMSAEAATSPSSTSVGRLPFTRAPSPPPTYTDAHVDNTTNGDADNSSGASSIEANLQPSEADESNLRRIPRFLAQLSQHRSAMPHQSVLTVVRQAHAPSVVMDRVVRRVLADAIDAWSGCAEPAPSFSADPQRHVNLFKELSEIAGKMNIHAIPIPIGEQARGVKAFDSCLFNQCLIAVDDWRALLPPRNSIVAPRADIDRVIPATTYIAQLVDQKIVADKVFDSCWMAMIAALTHLDAPLATKLRKFTKGVGRIIYTTSACLLIDDFFNKLERCLETPEDPALRYDIQVSQLAP